MHLKPKIKDDISWTFLSQIILELQVSEATLPQRKRKRSTVKTSVSELQECDYSGSPVSLHGDYKCKCTVCTQTVQNVWVVYLV